jgi:hypothetical protein
MKSSKLAEHLEPYFLNAVLHLRRIQNYPVTDAMDPVDMPVVQASGGISVTPLNCLNQRFVWDTILSIHHSNSTYESMNGNGYKEIDLLSR